MACDSMGGQNSPIVAPAWGFHHPSTAFARGKNNVEIVVPTLLHLLPAASEGSCVQLAVDDLLRRVGDCRCARLGFTALVDHHA